MTSCQRLARRWIPFLSLLAISSPALAGNNDWTMYNYDSQGTRHNVGETALKPSTVGGLHQKWSFATAAPVTGTPAVVGGTVYAGDFAGFVYAVAASTGALVWKTNVGAPISASALVTGTRVVLGDLAGNIWGLDRSTGAVAWKLRPDPNPVAAIWGSATRVGPYVAIGVSSNEEQASLDPNYPCCSTRGSLVLLDPQTGQVIWQTYTVTDAQLAGGSSGASIWSTPTYDETLGLLFASTGNNFSQPTTGTSDAIIAFNAATGAIVWANQRYPNDAWNYQYPNFNQYPDYDFADSPQVYRLPNKQKVVGAGQKSGFYHVLDAATGQAINQRQLEPGGLLGGLFADTAVAGGVVFANGINWPGYASGLPPVGGDLVAIAGDASSELWRFSTPYSPDLSGVAVANGVVYFTSLFNGQLFALEASSGRLLVQLTVGGSNSGPSVASGQVYVGLGNLLAGEFSGAIVALGL